MLSTTYLKICNPFLPGLRIFGAVTTVLAMNITSKQAATR